MKRHIKIWQRPWWVSTTAASYEAAAFATSAVKAQLLLTALNATALVLWTRWAIQAWETQHPNPKDTQ